MLPSLAKLAQVKVSEVPVNPPHPANTPLVEPQAAKPVVVHSKPVVVTKPVVAAQPPQRPVPVVKAPLRVGALRGGFTGFLLGVTLTGAASYYYLLDEYKQANNLIMADVIALQSSIVRLEQEIRKA
ncbi:hypothetical protein DICA4_E05952 [Diutina catenulata]